MHHDAYVAGVRAILGGWYETREKGEALFALDDLSSLGTTLANMVAYHRDCGERMVPARRYANVDAYQQTGKRDFGVDYLHLYDGSRWLVYGIPCEPNWISVDVKK